MLRVELPTLDDMTHHSIMLSQTSIYELAGYVGLVLAVLLSGTCKVPIRYILQSTPKYHPSLNRLPPNTTLILKYEVAFF